jgi:5'-nucleotidase
VDLTRFQALEKVSSWMQALSDDMATGQDSNDEAA